MLLTDTNILIRCAQGLAMKRAIKLSARNFPLATTVHNLHELFDRLMVVFGLSEQAAEIKIAEICEIFSVVDIDQYEHLRSVADGRLSAGGKSDWPLLSAALALSGDIWSDDRDFFGVGVPIWSTGNVHQYLPSADSAWEVGK